MRRDLAVERQPELDRPLDRPPVHHGQRAGEAEADGARLCVLTAAEAVCAAAEHLRPCLQLDVDLEPNDGFPRMRTHRSRSGTGSKPSARSSACPALKSVFSESCGPISCSPTGSPSESPHGTFRPGSPAMHEGIVSRSDRYIASGSAAFSPSLKATVGDVGETIRSKRSNAAACSCAISVRTF